MTTEQSYAMKWTKISDGRYRFGDTDYEAVKSEHSDGTCWYIWWDGMNIESVPSEPSRQFAGYAIQALIAEVSR